MSTLREEIYHYGRTPAQEYARSFPSYGSRQLSRDHDDRDGLSTTGSILTDYMVSYDSKHDARDTFPRTLPRSHSRAPPPCIDDVLYSKQDVYDAVDSVLAKSTTLRDMR